MPQYADVANCQSITDLLEWSSHPDNEGLDFQEVLSEFNSDQATQAGWFRKRRCPDTKFPSWTKKGQNKKNKGRFAIVLDIDETLGHSFHNKELCKKSTGCKPDIKIEFGNGNNYFFKCRPFLKRFLDSISKRFEVWIFTAGTQKYGEKIALGIERLYGTTYFGQKDTRRVFGRKYCTRVRGVGFVKNLTKFSRDRICIVDNSPISDKFQPKLGIDVESWYGKGWQRYDTWLYDFLAYLRKLSTLTDKNDIHKFIKYMNKNVNGCGGNKSDEQKEASDSSYCRQRKGAVVHKDDSSEISDF